MDFISILAEGVNSYFLIFKLIPLFFCDFVFCLLFFGRLLFVLLLIVLCFSRRFFSHFSHQCLRTDISVSVCLCDCLLGVIVRWGRAERPRFIGPGRRSSEI